MSDIRREEFVGATAGVTHTPQPVGIAGAMLGAYRLLELLGEGGMGEVWLAEQARPLRRQVAVKIIKAGLDTAQVIARFQAERQALALMDHPAIAKVFDAGFTDQGRPFFAMEYVRGEALTGYCDRHRLSIRERLELFVHVCEGVQHAHQKGIIHRDLKPSNILVIVQDDHPVPKIIDFGVAKATSQPLTEHTLHTSLGGFIGTPEYMSPEQAEMAGLDVDTRTDVYALGVILYELLTGVLPFDRVLFKARGIDEIRHTIREIDPARPSTRITQLGVASAEAAERRRLEPSRLAGRLRGDLDWVTMKALEKDRTRRYGSVYEVAADIRRHLGNQPVLAGPPTAVYRSRKFVRRHRFGVAAIAGALILLGVFAGTMAIQARRIARERDRANAEATRANLEAAAAKQVSDFLVGLFKVSDPNEARGHTLTVREILDKGARQIDDTLTERPDLQARLLATMGKAYTGLGSYEAAERLLHKAVANDRRVLGEEHDETLNAVHALANVYWYQGRYRDAEPLYRKVIESRRIRHGDGHPATLRANYDLASLYLAQDRLIEAEPLMRTTLEIQRRVLGEEHDDTVASLGNLGWLYNHQKRYAEAEPINVRVLELTRRQLGDQHPDTLASMHNVAFVYDRLERWAQAEELYIRTIAAKRHVLGETHDSTVLTIRRLAEMYRRTQRLSVAEGLLLGIAAPLLSPSNGDRKSAEAVIADLVTLYDEWGKPAKALEWRARGAK
jgi:non-specific serine/threonine protein kinase/serine/threonine-protein kinase